jgi:hypothetical protein
VTWTALRPLVPGVGEAVPELAVSRWFNSNVPIALAGLVGRVVMVEAFQMLCPGCVSHGLPQAQRARATFGDDVTVLGLHTVFEHHDAMTPTSLEAFLHEYRIDFPVGVDQARPGSPIPVTMQRWGLRGTPSLVLVGRDGRLRGTALGAVDDLALGATLARLVDEVPAVIDSVGSVAVCEVGGACGVPD